MYGVRCSTGFSRSLEPSWFPATARLMIRRVTDEARPDLLDVLLSERFVSQSDRQDLLKDGKAMKGPDGKPIFPIDSVKDAENAKTLYLSGHHQTPAAKQHILKNARRVGATGVVQALGGSS